MLAPTRRVVLSLLTLLALLLAIVPPVTPPVAAQAEGPLLSGSPASLAASVALGSTSTLSLTLRNESASAVIPRLYEALANSAQPAGRPTSARVPLPGQPRRVDPQIARELASSADGRTDLLVVLADQADLGAAYAIDDWGARGAYVYQMLRDHATASQRTLRALLDARGLAYRSLWIVNALAVRGDAAAVAELAGRAEVAELRANHILTLERQPGAGSAQITPSPCAAGSDDACWNIALVGANRAWRDFGVRGEGITVASIDSGVRYDHPALVGQYRGNRGTGFDHNYNWYDPYGNSLIPLDSGTHGTHTMGTMVARGSSASQPAVGVAPGARWIAARACSARECSEVDLILAAQWLLAPTDLAGNNPRPDLRPHVINNSWTAGQNATWYAGYVAAWRAAGIYPVFAAGNSGSQPGCGSIQSPGDYVNVTAVGATDNNDWLASFSSIGPTADGRIKPDLTAPGSGIYSTIADANRLYGTSSGTSMATPHVAGSVALLWSANPSLIGDYEATYALLTAAARPRTEDPRFPVELYPTCQPGTTPNNLYGYGRLDAYAAVARASVDVPWLRLPPQPLSPLAPGASLTLELILDARYVPGPGRYQARILVHGPDLSRTPLVIPVTLTVATDASYATLTGRVTRAADGQPLQATVAVVDGARVATDTEGRYQLVLPPALEPYTLVASARDYIAREQQVRLGPAETVSLDFALESDIPRLAADTTPRSLTLAFAEARTLPITISNQGSRTLSYTVALPNDAFGVWRSDEPDGPQATWIEPPDDAVLLALGDDEASGAVPIGFPFPYYDSSYEQLYIAANGFISFEPLPSESLSYSRSCLPLNETPGPAIVPLRVDLDPGQAGAAVSYAQTPAGLLVSWVNVPLYNDNTTRLSFQALLRPDGRISFNYRQVGTLPISESASYGLQQNFRQVQTLGCKAGMGLSDGLSLELRPQMPARVWLTVDQAAGSLAPGAASELAVQVRWIPAMAGGWPASGVVELASNDPTRPRVRFTVRLTSSAAPYRSIFPWIANRRGR